MVADFILIASTDTGFIHGLVPILKSNGTHVEIVKSESDFLARLPHCLIAILDIDQFIQFISIRKLTRLEKIIFVYDQFSNNYHHHYQLHFNKNDTASTILQLVDKCIDRKRKHAGIVGFAMEYRLSHRELELLELILNGLKSQEIAQQLGISIRTVERHRSSILRKTNCKTTSGLLRLLAHRSPYP